MNKVSTKVFDNPSDLIVKLKFLEFDESLSNFESDSISISVSIDEIESIRNKTGFLIEEHIFSLLVAEINQSIYKEITKRLLDTVKFDYIDLNKGNYTNQMQSQRAIVDNIIENKSEYSSLITSGMMCSGLSDVYGFNFVVSGSPFKGGLLYSTGDIMGIDVYVDPYMRYNDGRICLLDKVKINIKNFEFSTDMNVSTIMPRTLIKYDFSIDVGDSKIIFVIGEEFEDVTGQLKRLKRDIKIDSIIDGKEG